MHAQRSQRVASRIALALLAAAGVREARRAAGLQRRLQQAKSDLDRERADRERVRAELARANDALRRGRDVVRRLEASRRAEREWNRELRTQLQRLYAPQRRPGRRDVLSLILQAAIALVGAEKGLLLSREDANGDGDLDTILAEGFEHDPETSVVAQRFARRVLTLDEIVRDDAPTAGMEELSAADREIHTLVAIPVYLHDRFHGVIVCVNRPGGFEQVGDDVLLALGDQASAVLHQSQLRTEIREAHHGAIRALLEALSARDPERQRRSTALTLRASALAADLGFDEHETDVLVCAALLRDAGLLALSTEALAEPRPLRPDERAAMELHPRFGFNVIGQLPALRDVASAVLYHHEHFDGRGYPSGLTGDSIPRTARALAVLEAYDAMTCDRPYRPALSPEEARDELVLRAGAQFDPEIVQLFVERLRRDDATPAEPVADEVAGALPHDLVAELDGFAGPLTLASTDALTLLGNRRALEEDLAAAAATPDGGATPTLVLVEVQDLRRVNEELGFDPGDRLIQLAARNAQRAAARCGGAAYRASGRRIAVLAPSGRGSADDPAVVVEAEFVAGPLVRTARCDVPAGEDPATLLERARRELVTDS